MSIGRRGFLKVAAVGAGMAGVSAASASPEGTVRAADAPGVLVDTTLCVGCRGCEAACSETNGLPPPPESDAVMDQRRDTAPQVFTVVNRAETGGKEVFAKKQCMHCESPGCASACPVRAMDKLPSGPVVWDGAACLGCRYCMVACPFDIPKYEYDSWNPRVRKCTFCADRQAKGLKPACTEVCPTGALTFGRRGELLDEAKRRIYGTTGKYSTHIFGEHEAGGTSWLYITAPGVDLGALAFRTDAPNKAIPELVSGALSAPPFVMTLWPPLLMGLYMFSKRRTEASDDDTGHGPKGKGDGHV
jgi:formate dehydrogenase iron-sulfur subunit